MTEKRFKLRLSKLGNGMITDTQKREDLYFDKEFLDAALPKTYELLNELAEENEQLKSTIKEVIELLSEEVDLFIDKATEYDINACIKLKELDNKDAFYMAIVTKKAIKMLKELK